MGGPDPAVAAVRAAVRHALADLPPGTLVLVACSGGPDSLALAAATGFVAARSGLRAGAVVVDHGWHPDSGQVAEGAAQACRGLGLTPVQVRAVSAAAAPGGGGPEAAARLARYRALDAAADQLAAGAVLLGHTLDDQAESVLLGLARGSGARSLAGMPARRGRYRRPLLGLGRAVTVRACRALDLQPWTDPANADPAYARSRLRRAVSLLEQALGPGLGPALARSADLLREDADALDALAADLLARAVPETGEVPDAGGDRGGGAAVVLDVAVITPAAEAVRRRALLLAARRAGCPGCAGAAARARRRRPAGPLARAGAGAPTRAGHRPT